MPLYAYICENGHEFESLEKIADRNKAVCEDCGSIGKQQFGITHQHSFPEGFWSDIAKEPIYIKNKRHLQRVCREHGVNAPGQLNGNGQERTEY